MYRIEWTSLLTGYKGYGNWYKDKYMIEQWVEYLNHKYSGELVHKLGSN